MAMSLSHDDASSVAKARPASSTAELDSVDVDDVKRTPTSWAPHMPMRLRMIAAFGSAILVLIAGAASVVAMQHTESLGYRVRTSRLVLLSAASLRVSLADSEAGQRGFLLTRMQSDLEEYHEAVRDTRAEFHTLARLTHEDSLQRHKVEQLGALIDRRLNELAEGIAHGAEHDAGFDRRADETAQGRAVSARIRTILDTIRAEEDETLEERVASRVASSRITIGIVIGGTAIAFVLAILVNTALQRGISELARSRRITAEQATRLVEQRQELAAELARAAALAEKLTKANQELTRTAAQHERAMEALAAKNQELDQFAYVASHDLKAPLRGISNLAHWIEEDLGEALTPDVRQHITMMMGRVTRMEALIDGILQYARAGRTAHPQVDVNVDNLLDEVIELLAPTENIIQLHKPFPHVTGDRTQLQQVFMNLVSNALKHGRDATSTPAISVGCEVRGSEAEFFVADNGPGIAPQYHERIFRMFQILSSRDAVESTGVGLAVVRKIVETRGGRVWVESDAGKGAVFRFTWPINGENL